MEFTLKKDLPLKYHLGLYKSSREFPQKEDLLFALSTHFIKVASKKKPKPEEFQVTSDLLKDLFSDVKSLQKFRDFIKQCIPQLIQEERIVKNENGFLFNPSEILNFYERKSA